MDSKECVKNEKTNEKIEQELRNVSRAIFSLESIIHEIDIGKMLKVPIEAPEIPSRSISELIKETPKMLKEIAERIKNLSSRLRGLIL